MAAEKRQSFSSGNAVIGKLVTHDPVNNFTFGHMQDPFKFSGL